MPPSDAMPGGLLIVDRIDGRVPRLPAELDLMAKSLAAIHALLADPTVFVRDAAGAAAAAERLPTAQADLESVLERWMALEARNG